MFNQYPLRAFLFFCACPLGVTLLSVPACIHAPPRMLTLSKRLFAASWSLEERSVHIKGYAISVKRQTVVQYSYFMFEYGIVNTADQLFCFRAQLNLHESTNAIFSQYTKRLSDYRTVSVPPIHKITRYLIHHSRQWHVHKCKKNKNLSLPF